jgi:hypothetical protein
MEPLLLWMCLLVVKQYRDPKTYFAFLVGNSKYPGKNRLGECVQDARDMADLLEDSGYPKEHVVVVLDGTYDVMVAQLAAFTQLLAGARDCRVLLFFSGHGLEGAGGESILAPIDADLSSFRSTSQQACDASAHKFRKQVYFRSPRFEQVLKEPVSRMVRCSARLHGQYARAQWYRFLIAVPSAPRLLSRSREVMS